MAEGEGKGTLRAGLPAALYGGAFMALFYAVGTMVNTVSTAIPVPIWAAMGFLFAVSVKLSESL